MKQDFKRAAAVKRRLFLACALRGRQGKINLPYPTILLLQGREKLILLKLKETNNPKGEDRRVLWQKQREG